MKGNKGLDISSEKILILKSNKDKFESFYIEHMQTQSISTKSLYKYSKGFGWFLQVLYIEKLHLPFEQIWYGNWKKHLERYDTFIVFDRNLSWSVVSYIKKKKEDGRIIAWLWNSIKKPFPAKLREKCEVWSFDEEECRKFKYNENIQFYFSNITLKSAPVQFDVFFVGKDKGRYEIVKEIEQKIKKLGFSTLIIIVKDKMSRKENKYNKELEYDQILNLISRSSCIIDVPQEGQYGITVRVLEAIFYEKKLITTDVRIKDKEYYDDKNMYVWDGDMEGLKLFLERPYEKGKVNLKEKYSFQKWIDNFMRC